MKKNILYALAALFVLAISSCTKSSAPEPEKDIYIDVSTEILNFSSHREDKVIEVKTNASSWRVTKPTTCEWIKVVPNTTNFIIVADQNGSATGRKAYVTIQAGGTSREIIINQEGANSDIELSSTELSVDHKKGEYLIKVLRSNTNWQIEGLDDYTWFTVLKSDHALSIQVSENGTYDVRKGKFFITSPVSQPIEITITQQGQDAFMLPYLPNKLITKRETLSDTKEKGMFYVQGIPNTKKTGFIFEFEANDGRDSKAGYEFLTGKELYSNFRLYTKNSEYGMTPEFHNFLLNKGFIFEDENIVKGVIEKRYFYDTFFYQAVLLVQINPIQKHTLLTFNMKEVQAGNMPTFTKFPYRNIGMLNTYDFWDVKKWEENEGDSEEVLNARKRGDKNPNIIASAQFVPNNEDNSRIVTLYFFEERNREYMGKLNQRLDIYSDPSLGLWTDTDGRYWVTREFDKLLQSEGLQPQSRRQSGGRQWITYFDPTRKLVVMITLLEQPTGEQEMAISYYVIIDSEENSQRMAVINAEKALSIYK